jgi:K+/H+ antiporter YhaU regulatory subunit KhtT
MGEVVYLKDHKSKGAQAVPDLSNRLVRIRASLEKINKLMGELKKMENTDVDDSKNKR